MKRCPLCKEEVSREEVSGRGGGEKAASREPPGVFQGHQGGQ